ncbi:MAG: helix-turn-helix domain-containing protein [Myxococcales bacterium]|nr:helix-turn-helix domain-containing protein [Myxococcales bacterium]
MLEISERLWDARKVGEYLGMSLSWVKAKAADGTLPAMRWGKMYRFEPAAIVRWAASKRVSPPVVVGR